MHYLGNEDRIETKLMFLTCDESDVTTVTSAVIEMSKRKLFPGQAQFCGFDVFGVGEIEYRKMLNSHTKHINATKLTSIVDIHTPDLERVKQQKRYGYSLRETYLQSKAIILEPSNIKGKFHFLSQDKAQLDEFIYKQLFPRLNELQPDTPPRIINRGLRSEDYSEESEEYMRELIESTEQIEQTIKLQSKRSSTKTYSQATIQQRPSSTVRNQSRQAPVSRNNSKKCNPFW